MVDASGMSVTGGDILTGSTLGSGQFGWAGIFLFAATMIGWYIPSANHMPAC
jgi:hypothetical protein